MSVCLSAFHFQWLRTQNYPCKGWSLHGCILHFDGHSAWKRIKLHMSPKYMDRYQGGCFVKKDWHYFKHTLSGGGDIWPLVNKVGGYRGAHAGVYVEPLFWYRVEPPLRPGGGATSPFSKVMSFKGVFPSCRPVTVADSPPPSEKDTDNGTLSPPLPRVCPNFPWLNSTFTVTVQSASVQESKYVTITAANAAEGLSDVIITT